MAKRERLLVRYDNDDIEQIKKDIEDKRFENKAQATRYYIKLGIKKDKEMRISD